MGLLDIVITIGERSLGNLNIQILATRLREKGADQGVRAVAKEIGISPATLSRVQRGYLPDLETFRKICDWLKLDPSEVLGLPTQGGTQKRAKAMIHFKKDKTIKPETATALGKLILAAQRALSIDDGVLIVIGARK